MDALTALIVVPTLDIGAADAGAVELASVLAAAGHKPIVVSSGGRLVSAVTAAGAEFVAMNVATQNPVIMLRNATALARLLRERRCDLIHALGRAPAWSAYYAARRTGVPFLTTWYKGFREQNVLKRFYNGVMVRGDRVIAVSDQIADLVSDRYGIPWDRIAVIPASLDLERFDPARVDAARIEATRHAWGIKSDTRVILVAGRLRRRKGHHIVVEAARRLKERGLQDFACVFLGEDQGHTRYAGEVWDLVLASDAADVIRMVGPADDMPAAYAAASVVVSASTQPDGLPRAVLEAQAMGRPVIVSDLSAGPDVVLAPPAVPEERMTGLRFSSGDAGALAGALIRLFSLPESTRCAIGARGRSWMVANFDGSAVVGPLLRLYAEVAHRHRHR